MPVRGFMLKGGFGRNFSSSDYGQIPTGCHPGRRRRNRGGSPLEPWGKENQDHDSTMIMLVLRAKKGKPYHRLRAAARTGAHRIRGPKG